jgi:class 3 adenylate cyclase
MDVAAWLSGLGLEQYVELFRENDIDGEILCGMTAEDLKELGISSFGHRRRLLNAIAALGGQPPTRDVARSAPSVISAPTSPPPIDAERRQLTVIFCDLVGSTALSAQLDPEDLREVIAAHHRAVTDVVGNLDGFIAKYMGDGVLIYFGYPQAHEDDAERAVLAGLELIEEVAALKTHAPLQTRIGIATGLVVVGDVIGSGEAQERGVVGETPNLAARLQGMAAPNMIVVADGRRCGIAAC